MKIICSFILALYVSLSVAQIPLTQIEGYLEVYNPIDTTSIYIGKGSGKLTDHTNPNKNAFVGHRAGAANIFGIYNAFFGASAGQSNTEGGYNAFFGASAGQSNTEGDYNSFFGVSAGRSNAEGDNNSFFGAFVGELNTSGSNNAFFGSRAGYLNTTGSENSFFGRNAGRANTEGDANSFFGQTAGASNKTGTNNAFFGFESGQNNDSAGGNSFFGATAGSNNTTGAGNTLVGQGAGYNNTSGSSNTFIGNSAGLNSNGESNTLLGAVSGAHLTGSNNITLGALAGPPFGGGAVSNRLYIDNTESPTPLIYGELDNDLVVINHKAATSGNGHLRGFRINNSNQSVYWNFYTFNSGTLGLYKTDDGNEKFQFKTNGDFITDGAVNPSSDRNRKELFTKINPEIILEKIARLPITEWQYKESEERHIGPMAQDFYAAFGLGLGETTIATVDADGVALAAIKALALENDKLTDKNNQLEKRVAALEDLILRSLKE